MDGLTKRNENGVAYMTIADKLSKEDQIIEGSKPILEGFYAILQKLADYEDIGSVEYVKFCVDGMESIDEAIVDVKKRHVAFVKIITE